LIYISWNFFHLANDILFAIDEQIAEEELKEIKAQKKK